MRKKILAIAAILLLSVPALAQKYEHLADTPPMGWNSWNKFQRDIDEEKITGIIDAMVSTGLRDAGYVYVNLDDCWHGQRDKDGFIQCDPKKFPHGIKWLADYAHSRGLKLGIYSDAGYETCANKPGSLGHEYQDALQYARWGIDYLKLDWCNAPNINVRGAYQLMSDALRAAGRPIVLSMCEWGSNKPWRWARDIGNLWRTTGDINHYFDDDAMKDLKGWHGHSVMEIISRNDTLRQYAGPNHWNDPDMLEVGNGMSTAEDRSHFTIWCMMASPLILGNDLRTMSQETRDIILNKDLIAVDQDSLGIQGWHFRNEQGLQLWLKPLKNGDWAFAIMNPTKETVKYDINWQRMNVTDPLSKRSTGFDQTAYKVYNLWTHRQEGKTSLKDKKDRTVSIASHDVVAYRLQLNSQDKKK